MYRRIELIHPRVEIDLGPFGSVVYPGFKAGIVAEIDMGPFGFVECRELKAELIGMRRPWEVREILAGLSTPRKRIKSCRQYFTERGWDEVGREVIAACRRSGQQYRVIAVKERSVDVVWRDAAGLQVGVRARKKVAEKVCLGEYE